MPELSFRKIGIDPQLETEMLYELCSGDGIDEAILSEFPRTIAAYGQPPNDTAINRIMDRYGGEDPVSTGSIVLMDRIAIGLAYSSVAEYQREQDNQAVVGINVSSWLSSRFRGQGIGNHIIRQATQKAIEQSSNPDLQSWHNKRIWTSIRIGNIASIRACENVGFVNSGAELRKDKRSIYLLNQYIEPED